MRRGVLLWFLAALALVATRCSRPPAGTAREPGAEAPAGPSKPGSAAALAGQATLPPSEFGGVPGWLGFVVRPADQRARGWTPAHPDANVVIVDANAWSKTAEAGTRLQLVSREGNLPLTLSGVSQIPYGCDQNMHVMAGFRTPHDLAEQLVWILPGATTGASTALPVIARAAVKQQREWTVRSLAIRTQLDHALEGRLEVRENGAVVFSRPFEKPAMDGADMAPLDLTQEFEIGAPYVEAAFRLDPALTLVVVRTVTYEGVRFEVLVRRDTGKLEHAGGKYVALCAF